MALKPWGRKAPALIRFLTALAVLFLFVYAYLSPGLGSNGILALLIKGQFSAVLYGAGIAGFVLVILALTLIFGRLYCSVLCPLGTAQELFWRVGKLLTGKLLRGKSPLPDNGTRIGERAPSTNAASPPRKRVLSTEPASVTNKASARLFRRGYAAPPAARYAIPLLVAVGVVFSFTPLMVIPSLPSGGEWARYGVCSQEAVRRFLP